TGTFGGGLWIWLVNLQVLAWWQGRKTAQGGKKYAIRAAVLTLLPMLISLGIYFTYEEEGETIDVVVVQPNYEPHYEKFIIPEEVQIGQFLDLSLSKLDQEVDYLVFPETSYGLVKEQNIWADASSRRLSEELSSFPDLKLVTGLNAYHDFKPDEPLSSAVRERTRGNRTIQYEIMNLAAQLQIADRGEPVQTYRKSKLVPGPEAFPFQTVFFFLKPLVDQLGGTTAGLGTQPERSVFSSETAKIAPVICYESIFGEYYNGYIKAGAQAAFIMTNDGWWDNTAGHRQHLYFASLRAIETRRPIARSANTGISAFVNQRGDISQMTDYGVPAAIRGQLVLADTNQQTFYYRWGDLIARIALFTAILFLLNTFVKARIK
ncbi:MAG: apolipoprotein N-acyltransferase, partial [Bacteroidota bacterium]